MSERSFVGLNPALPWPLRLFPWWTEPVRAERLAAFRIALSAVLLLDILATQLPLVTDLYGARSLGSAEVFLEPARPRWFWSLLGGIDDPAVIQLVMLVWATAALALLVGLCARLNAAVCWALSLSFLNLNYFTHNAGDTVKVIGLFYLMLSPCGAVWSIDARLARRRGEIFVSPWALRLLFVQLTAIYFFSGIHKLSAPDWRDGDTLHYILADLGLARWPYAEQFVPVWLLKLGTWIVLVWEIAFPLLVLIPRARPWALGLGVALHVGLALSTELGVFPLYALSFYVPLLPWERRAAPR